MTTPVRSMADQNRDVSIDELIVILRDSQILDALGFSTDDLVLVHSDADLLETLRITHEFVIALEASDVLETFLKLRRKDQANFLRWIGMTDDHALRAQHTTTFIAALRGSPLGPTEEASGA